ncbi:hypothetical protein IAU59_000612 [Kwoniella sp. CBS 9459]
MWTLIHVLAISTLKVTQAAVVIDLTSELSSGLQTAGTLNKPLDAAQHKRLEPGETSTAAGNSVVPTLWSTVTVTSSISTNSDPIPTLWTTETITSEPAAVDSSETATSDPLPIPTAWSTVYSTRSLAGDSEWQVAPVMPSTVWSTVTSYSSESLATSAWEVYPSLSTKPTSSSTTSATTSGPPSSSSSSQPTTRSADGVLGMQVSTTFTTTTLQPTPTDAPYGFLMYRYGQNVIMTDVTANNHKYKSKASNNYNPDWYTVNLLTDRPTHSRRMFEMYKPNDKGDFGPDVEGSNFTRGLACEFTFHPGKLDNKPVFVVWDAEPYYYQWDPANKLDMNCTFDNKPDVFLTE